MSGDGNTNTRRFVAVWRGNVRVKGVYERDGVIYIRARKPGEEKISWIRVAEQSVGGAERLLRDLARARTAEQAAAVRSALAGVRSRREFAGVARVLAVYEQSAERQRQLSGKPSAATARQNVNALRLICRCASEANLAGLGVDRLPELARAYAHAQLEGGANRRSVATVLRLAKSVFARWMGQYFHDAEVRLPEGFLARWPSVSSGGGDFYVLPERALRERTIEAGNGEIKARSELGLAFVLCFYAGMAAADAARAEWDWVKWDAAGTEGAKIVYCRRKTGKRADPPLPPEVVEALRAYRRADLARVTVLDGDPTHRANLINRTLARWMRELGWTRNKCAHELRKLACSYWATECGIQWAARWIGDDEATAAKYYRDLLPERAPMPPSLFK